MAETKKHPGLLYEVAETFPQQYAVSFHDEQHDAFLQAEKLFVHLFHDPFQENPVLHAVGQQPKSVLKHISKLKRIGNVD